MDAPDLRLALVLCECWVSSEGVHARLSALWLTCVSFSAASVTMPRAMFTRPMFDTCGGHLTAPPSPTLEGRIAGEATVRLQLVRRRSPSAARSQRPTASAVALLTRHRSEARIAR